MGKVAGASAAEVGKTAKIKDRVNTVNLLTGIRRAPYSPHITRPACYVLLSVTCCCEPLAFAGQLRMGKVAGASAAEVGKTAKILRLRNTLQNLAQVID